jgi:hypothetical protein
MAKKKSTRGRKSATERPITPAQRDRAIKFLQKQGGAHISRPANGLIQDTPARTIERCKGVISWLAHIEQPFSGGELDAAEADVLLMVADALGHAEKVVRSVGAQADAQMEVAHG